MQEQLTLEDLVYELPEELIAQEPLKVRHESRLLILDRASGNLKHESFPEIVSHLDEGDLLVVNDTRVIPARLLARRKSGGEIRVQLVKAKSTNTCLWEAMAMPMRRIKEGETLLVDTGPEGKTRELKVAEIIQDPDGFKRLIVDMIDNENMRSIIQEAGHAPLPPYIKRELDLESQTLAEKRKADIERYQTIFAEAPGAVAAPTAGLHFSEAVLAKLKEKGVNLTRITLHVGAGTFKPITSSIEDHSVESESFSISKETAASVNETRARGNRVIAVGTTSMRALESSVEDGELIEKENASTSLYIKPGFKFQVADAMVTNFHLSGSSLLVLVATFAGKDAILKAYREAVKQRYRFYSYGDAMLIL